MSIAVDTMSPEDSQATIPIKTAATLEYTTKYLLNLQGL